jgi:prolyl-tRNA editing enzyme YbaK/EbsC (Cys-tRNA(Pro) deacylase)
MPEPTRPTQPTELIWVPALERPDLLAPSTAAALDAWAGIRPEVADEVRVAEIDPALADTAALNAAYGLPSSGSVNCVLVVGRRGGEERFAAAGVRATTRADVNNAVRRLLDVRKATFLATERAVAESGMEYGGITFLGLPPHYRVLLDASVARSDPDAGDRVLIGSGVRRSKLSLPGVLLAAAPGVELVDGLGLG